MTSCANGLIGLTGSIIARLKVHGDTNLHEGYFTKNIQPLLNKSSSKLAEAHSMFWLSAANNEIMPVSKYFEADVTSIGFPNSTGGIPCGEGS